MQDETDNITIVDPTNKWVKFRIDMAIDLFNSWQSS